MRYFFIVSALLLLCDPCGAQWHKVRDFPYIDNLGPEKADILCIYFLDKVGLPNVGYIGTGQDGLWKTTDGGTTWQPSLGKVVWQIFFKDSLTGWLDIYRSFARTSDGGVTWTPKSTASGGFTYCAPSNRLWATFSGGFQKPDTLKFSTDLGDSWNFSIQIPSPSVDFDSFFGLGRYFWPDWSTADTQHGGFLVSSDCGSSWDTIPFPNNDFLFGIGRILLIPETGTCFVNAGKGCVYKSEDYGRSWRKIYTFSDPRVGLIKGSLDRLLITSDSEFFVSWDQGLNWTNIGGPPTSSDFLGRTISDYYVLGNKIFANISRDDGMAYSELWEGEIPPDASVKGMGSSEKLFFVYPNPTNTGTVLTFGMAQNAYVRIELYDLLGNVAARDGRSTQFEQYMSAGNHSVPIDMSALPAGTYYARIVTAYGETRTVKIVKS